MWFVIAILGVVSVVTVVAAPGRWRESRRIARTARALARAPWLDAGTSLGSLAKVVGEVRFPSGLTPYGQRPASYWESEVRAEFETKAKKPGSGMVTHTPVLERTAMADQPLMLETPDGNAVQVHFARPDRAIRDLRTHELQWGRLPPALEHLARDKHQRYRVVERHLPARARVLVYGRVLDRNDACTTLGDPATGPLNAFVTTMMEPELLRANYRAARGILRRQVMWTAICGLGWWGVFHVAF